MALILLHPNGLSSENKKKELKHIIKYARVNKVITLDSRLTTRRSYYVTYVVFLVSSTSWFRSLFVFNLFKFIPQNIY